ncbi:hypothetical protein BJX99DRAFT_263970 [Aspergillus californicus]
MAAQPIPNIILTTSGKKEYSFASRKSPPDTVVYYGDATFFVHFNKLKNRIHTLQETRRDWLDEDDEDQNPTACRIRHQLNVTDNYVEGALVNVITWNDSNVPPQPTPGEAFSLDEQNHVAPFCRWMYAVYGISQRFSSPGEVNLMFSTALHFGRYQWLGKYFNCVLAEAKNQHLWLVLDIWSLHNLTMADILGIQWLYRHLAIFIGGSYFNEDKKVQENMLQVLTPQSRTLMESILKRHVARLAKIWTSIQQFYDVFRQEAAKRGHKDTEAPITQLRESIPRRYISDRRQPANTARNWLTQLRQALYPLQSQYHSVFQIGMVKTAFDRCLSAIDKNLEDGLQLKLDIQPGYITNILEPGDLEAVWNNRTYHHTAQ